MSEETTNKIVKPSDWFMYHGGYAHGGHVTGSSLTSDTVQTGKFDILHSIETPGSILSVPAIVNGFIYVGLANSRESVGSNGGTLQRYNIATGQLVDEFTWSIQVDERDVHGFTGMGCTPTVINDCVYFIGFDAVLYCLDANDLTKKPLWTTNLRHVDLDQNQPINNTGSVNGSAQGVPAEGWSSPLVIDVSGVPKVILGIGEGENPFLMSFIYCLDATTGKVDWVFCTCQFEIGQINSVNQIPKAFLSTDPSVNPMFTTYDGVVDVQGSSVWSAIAYDEETGLLYAGTGQPASPADVGPAPDFNSVPAGQGIDKGLNSSPGWTSGILSLDAATGNFHKFQQMPADTSYRPTDFDVDIGSAPTIYTIPANGNTPAQKVVGISCKNGGFMVCDAQSLEVIKSRSLLPYYNEDGIVKNDTWKQIPTVDMHPAPGNNDNPTNEESNENWGENYSGPFNTAAFDPRTGTVFVGIGGPNYHSASPGIDYLNTPFMRAFNGSTLEDAWPMSPADATNPKRYTNIGASMYTTPGESGLSSPAVVNDVVFMTTSRVAIYAFRVSDGTLLWSDVLGSQTGGMQGGYGYCLGAAIWGDFVVAGALIAGQTGGVLNIYGPKFTAEPSNPNPPY
jgi:glucose dehydrogenase